MLTVWISPYCISRCFYFFQQVHTLEYVSLQMIRLLVCPVVKFVHCWQDIVWLFSSVVAILYVCMFAMLLLVELTELFLFPITVFRFLDDRTAHPDRK